MNYHIEYHMLPMVPYHSLPALHKELNFDYPEPSPNVWSVIREVFVALARQGKDPDYTIIRSLPATANPYYYGPSAENGKKGKRNDRKDASVERACAASLDEFQESIN